MNSAFDAQWQFAAVSRVTCGDWAPPGNLGMLERLGALSSCGAANRMPAMQLLLNTTSPYARIARIALAEKGHADIATEIVDPWGDTPRLLEFNPAARVPALVTDEGRPLTESLLIVLWLENQRPTPSLLGSDPTAAVSRAGIAMGVIDAAVHTLIGRKITDASFDTSPVGLRRRRSMIQGLSRLEADPPAYATGTPTIDTVAAVVALDYVRFRFPQATWLPALPRLDALAARAHERASFANTMPREMQKP
jgi:glutathione S-transferase